MIEFIQSITEPELRFVASLNNGQEDQSHYNALNKLIFNNSCSFEDNQRWFPYEVIELGAHWLQAKHEREFVICNLLVIHAVNTGFDTSTDLEQKLADRTTDYDKLPGYLLSIVLNAYSTTALGR